MILKKSLNLFEKKIAVSGVNMGNYEIILYWSEEDKLYIAEVPELKGCFADGKTRAEAISNAELVIAEWLEVAKEDGIAIPKAKGKLMFA